MQHHEAVVVGIVVADDARQIDPVVDRDVRRVDWRGQRQHLDIDIEPFERGKFVVYAAEIERHQCTGLLVGLHADRTAGIDYQNR